MLNLPAPIVTALAVFAPLFSRRVFSSACMLLIGHLTCTGARTITNFLREIGLSNERRYSRFHDVIRKAKWSSLKASRLLLQSIVVRWIGEGTLHIIVDSTLERRRGPRIEGLGVHRDATASTKKRKVLSVGHNWLVFAVLVQFPGAKHVWSLPFLSVLLRPMEPLGASRNPKTPARHKKMTRYVEQVVMQLRRWVGPNINITLTADSAFCSKRICRTCQKHNVRLCTRLRLDASLCDFPPEKKPARGRPRIVGARLRNLSEIATDPETSWSRTLCRWYGGGTRTIEVCTGSCLWYHNSTGKPVPIRWVLTRDPEAQGEVVAILCTDPNSSVADIIGQYVSRWSIEVTFQEIRTHFRFGTSRTWSDLSIERMAPSIIASFSVTCLIAAEATEQRHDKIQPVTTAWYQKQHVTFSDTLAYVRSLVPRGSNLTQNEFLAEAGENMNAGIHPRMAC